MPSARQMPVMPPIGRPESFYAQEVQSADRDGDHHSHEAFKVGQYITLALNPHLPWESKLKFFDHALRRHCSPPALPGEDVWLFYRSLTDLVRQYAGSEALKLACKKDDEYAHRVSNGEDRDHIADEAASFFRSLMGTGCKPANHFHDEDWAQLLLIRDQWV